MTELHLVLVDILYDCNDIRLLLNGKFGQAHFYPQYLTRRSLHPPFELLGVTVCCSPHLFDKFCFGMGIRTELNYIDFAQLCG